MNSFEYKKWTLFTLCLIGIVLTTAMITTVVPSLILDYAEPWTEYDKQLLKITRGLIIGLGVLGTFFQFIGLFGAYLENLWLTCIFYIIMTVVTLGSIALAITIGPVYWGMFVLNLVITILALLFARDLYEQLRS